MPSGFPSGAIDASTRHNYLRSASAHDIHDDARVELKFEESRLKEDARALYISKDDRGDPLRMPKSELSGILMQSREPMTAKEIEREYFNINEYAFPAKKHGFDSLTAFLDAFPDKYHAARMPNGHIAYRAKLSPRLISIRQAVLNEEINSKHGRSVASGANPVSFVAPRSRLLDDDHCDGGVGAAPSANPASSLHFGQRVDPPPTTRNHSTADDRRPDQQPWRQDFAHAHPKLTSSFVAPHSRWLSGSAEISTKKAAAAAPFSSSQQERVGDKNTSAAVTASHAPIMFRPQVPLLPQSPNKPPVIAVATPVQQGKTSVATAESQLQEATPKSDVNGHNSTLIVAPRALKSALKKPSSLTAPISVAPISTASISMAPISMAPISTTASRKPQLPAQNISAPTAQPSVLTSRARLPASNEASFASDLGQFRSVTPASTQSSDSTSSPPTPPRPIRSMAAFRSAIDALYLDGSDDFRSEAPPAPPAPSRAKSAFGKMATLPPSRLLSRPNSALSSPALGALTAWVKKTQADYEREKPRLCNGRLGAADVPESERSSFVSAD